MVILSCGDFQRGGWGHNHDGFSCHFGKYHKYRMHVDDFRYRPLGTLSNEMCDIYIYIFSSLDFLYCLLKNPFDIYYAANVQ